MSHIHAKLSIRLREEVGAVKYQSGINGDSVRKLAQSRLFSLRRRYEGRIPVIPHKGAQALRRSRLIFGREFGIMRVEFVYPEYV